MPKAATLDTIRRALEAVGAVFLSDDDVRLRTAPFEVKTLKLRSSSLHATAAAARGAYVARIAIPPGGPRPGTLGAVA